MCEVNNLYFELMGSEITLEENDGFHAIARVKKTAMEAPPSSLNRVRFRFRITGIVDSHGLIPTYIYK